MTFSSVNCCFSFHAPEILPFCSPSWINPNAGEGTTARSKRFIDPGCTSQQPSAPESAAEAYKLCSKHTWALPEAQSSRPWHQPYKLLCTPTRKALNQLHNQNSQGFLRKRSSWDGREKVSQEYRCTFCTSLQIPSIAHLSLQSSLGLSINWEWCQQKQRPEF
jgi:hypothetical protein